MPRPTPSSSETSSRRRSERLTHSWNTVAKSPAGLDEGRQPRLVQLGAQCAHHHLDHPIRRIAQTVVQTLEQGSTREAAAAMTQQGLEQRVLLRCERQRRAARGGNPRVGIQDELAAGELARDLPVATTQQRQHPRLELGEIERLEQYIVRPP